LEALKGLYIKDINQSLRGQYLGYKEEAQNPYSKVETFVSITLNSNDPRWEGVPMTLTTGKALNTKTTEIKIS
jgi:glucose-6-phosphate 1-dehydrogenase